MTVELLVLRFEGGAESGNGGIIDLLLENLEPDFRGLPLEAYIAMALQLHLFGPETLTAKLIEHAPGHLGSDILQSPCRQSTTREKAAANVVVLDPGA